MNLFYSLILYNGKLEINMIYAYITLYLKKVFKKVRIPMPPPRR